MLEYRIKTVGLDIGSVNSGVFALELISSKWTARALEGVAIKTAPDNPRENKFIRRLSVANKMVEFVKKHKPDLVGIEDYSTHKGESFNSIDMAELGGIVRTLLWQEGFRQLSISATKLRAMALHPGANKVNARLMKKYAIQYVSAMFNVNFNGSFKEQSDMADAALYGFTAACFFSWHWLKIQPPMNSRQRRVFYSRLPSPGSKAFESYKPTGLMEIPHSVLIRNPEKEIETYTPEWMRVQPE